MAYDGSIFLDEITQMPPNLQVKLLRVLEQGSLRLIGGRQEIEIDVRVISATNRFLFPGDRRQKLREDLYYRLNVFPIPRSAAGASGWTTSRSWRQRFEKCSMKKEGKNITSFEAEVVQALEQHLWPVYVRELRNAMNRAYILASSNTITVGSPRTH